MAANQKFIAREMTDRFITRASESSDAKQNYSIYDGPVRPAPFVNSFQPPRPFVVRNHLQFSGQG
jgi:hypothetical protein